MYFRFIFCQFKIGRERLMNGCKFSTIGNSDKNKGLLKLLSDTKICKDVTQ